MNQVVGSEQEYFAKASGVRSPQRRWEEIRGMSTRPGDKPYAPREWSASTSYYLRAQVKSQRGQGYVLKVGNLNPLDFS